MPQGFSPPRENSILKNVFLKFAMCFWVAGLKAPQAEGFVTKLELKPDAFGKCRHPFRFSHYDQCRFEFHEHIDAAEGKALWAAPQASFTFASFSFVVDQEGERLLG